MSDAAFDTPVLDPVPVAEFGQRLRALLDERGLSLRRGAEAIGCSTGSLANWTRGRGGPNYAELQKLSKFFGINPATPRSAAGIAVSHSTATVLLSRTERIQMLQRLDHLEAKAEKLVVDSTAIRAAAGRLRNDLEQLN